MDEIRNYAGVPYGDLSILALSRAAEHLGFRTVSLKLSSDELNEQIHFPAIAHTQGQHYVVIEDMTPGHVCIADPAYGRYRLSKSAFQQRWMDQGRGILLVMEPSDSFVTRQMEARDPEPSQPRMEVYIPEGWTLVQFLLEGLVLLGFFQLFRTLIRPGTSSNWPELLISSGFALLSFLALVLIHDRWMAWKQLHIVEIQDRICFALPSSSGMHGDQSMIYPQVSGLAMQVSTEWYGRAAGRILDQYRAVSMMFFLVIYLLWVAPAPGLLFLAISLMLWLSVKWTSRTALGQMVIDLEEELESRYGLREMEQDSPAGEVRESVNWPASSGRRLTIGWIRLMGVFWFIMVLFGYRFVQEHMDGTGLLVICGVVGFELLYVLLIGERAKLVASMWLPGVDLGGATNREEKGKSLKGDLGLTIPVVHSDGSTSLEEIIRLPVKKSSLVFGADQPYKLQVFNQLVGLTSGEEAQLIFGGQGLDQAGLKEWEGIRMMVQRSDRLPMFSIGEVITGRTDYDEHDPHLQEALSACLLNGHMRLLPDGLDTIVGFSGWQTLSLTHQILAARALYQQPAWLFLDDVFGHLEPFQEQVLFENILQSRQGLATVIFSRRMELTGVVDWVVHIREGKVVEQGTFAQLINSEGYLYSLITSS